MAEIDHTLALATELARLGGSMVRAELHRAGGPRGSGDHATVDEEVERAIRQRLAAELSDWGFRGEETGSSIADPPPRYVWLVDPNDGTRPFLEGARGSAVSIALLRDRQPVLGVVFSPCAPDDDGDLLCWAEGCGPPTRNGVPFERPAWPAAPGRHDLALVSHDLDAVALTVADLVAPGRFRALPSIAYRLALAAAGDADLGTSFKGAGDWDYCGGHALLRGTGGVLVDQDGRSVVYGPDGVSRGQACFGGAAGLAREMAARPWARLVGTFPPTTTLRQAQGTLLPREGGGGWGEGGRRAGPEYPAELAPVALRRGQAIADAGLLRRAQGCLLGQVAGDSLGSLVEFQPPEWIRERYPDGLRQLADGGTHRTIAGQPTDDSELALMLARSVVARNAYDEEAAARAYGYWYQSRPFDIGGTTRQALAPIPRLELPLLEGNPGLRASDVAGSHASAQSEANGSLMRISPIGIWAAQLAADAAAEAARMDSALTHPSPVCQEACAVFATAIAFAVGTGASAREVYRFALEWAERHCEAETVTRAVAAAAQGPPAEFMRNQGWVLIALQNAFARLLHAASLEAGIVETVMAGGDTDTNAAIAGALLGAVYGREAVPMQWRRLVLSCRPIAGLPGVERSRPRPFWPVDLYELAERLLLAGS